MCVATFRLRNICFILMSVTFIIYAENETYTFSNRVSNSTSPWNTDFSSRSLYMRMPRKLQVRIRLAPEKEINLKWVKTLSSMANKHLPIIAPLDYSFRNVMAEVGNFIMYRNLNACSTVVYFEELNALFGVVGTRHYIHALPYNFDANGTYQLGIVEKPYITDHAYPFGDIKSTDNIPTSSELNEWQDSFLLYIKTLVPHIDLITNDTSLTSGSTTPNPRTIIDNKNSNSRSKLNLSGKTNINFIKYYLEILVFVTQDVVDIFKMHFGKEFYVKWIVNHYVIYFNTIQMLLRKLYSNKSSALEINIAKIVIEDALNPLSFLNENEFQYTEIIKKLPLYLHNNRNDFPPDSFDYVFIHSSREIWNNSILVRGITKSNTNLYEARSRGRFYYEVPVTITTFQFYHVDYLEAIKQIGQIFNMIQDPREVISNSTDKKNSHCINCLEGNIENKRKFNQFFKNNQNRCFLQNIPRSRSIPKPSRIAAKYRQCQCYGFDSYFMNNNKHSISTIDSNECAQPLECEKIININIISIKHTVLPFDGTPCGFGKVCWMGNCTKI